jgi:hypothetical protein
MRTHYDEFVCVHDCPVNIDLQIATRKPIVQLVLMRLNASKLYTHVQHTTQHVLVLGPDSACISIHGCCARRRAYRKHDCAHNEVSAVYLLYSMVTTSARRGAHAKHSRARDSVSRMECCEGCTRTALQECGMRIAAHEETALVGEMVWICSSKYVRSN